MKPEEITDDMVLRACGAALGEGWCFTLTTEASMRRVLEAAIRERRKAERRGASYNPFSRPGVNKVPEVSEGIIQAGQQAVVDTANRATLLWDRLTLREIVSISWKAMYSKHLEERDNPDLGIR